MVQREDEWQAQEVFLAIVVAPLLSVKWWCLIAVHLFQWLSRNLRVQNREKNTRSVRSEGISAKITREEFEVHVLRVCNMSERIPLTSPNPTA